MHDASDGHLFTFKLRIFGEGVDQGGMAGGRKEGGEEGVVPTVGAVEGGIMGMEGFGGGGGAFEIGFGGRWHDEDEKCWWNFTYVKAAR